MIDRLKKSFDVANNAYIEAFKIFKFLGIFLGKWAWIICPPIILIDHLSFLVIPILAWWWVFWLSYFFGDHLE